MNYLLDTNACIALMAHARNPVQDRFLQTVKKRDRVYTSSIVAFELWYGVFKSSRIESNQRRVETFLSGPITLLPVEDGDARNAGEIRAALEAEGKPIGAYDLLIAGQAMNREMTVVTANTSEFSRVKGLNWEDWSR